MLQEVITSIPGWVAILFGDFYEAGDRVQLGAIKGDVIDIGVLRTTLMGCVLWVDGAVKIITEYDPQNIFRVNQEYKSL